MFLANRLLNRTQKGNSEISSIDGGRYFLVRLESLQGRRECLLINANLSIRASEEPHLYRLVVTKTSETKDKQFDDDSSEDVEERAFDLTSDLFFALGQSTAQQPLDGKRSLSFTWSTDPLGGSPDDLYEYLLPPTVTETVAKRFEESAWICMWEHQEQKDWPTDAAAQEEARASLPGFFAIEPPEPRDVREGKIAKGNDDDIASGLGDVDLSKEPSKPDAETVLTVPRLGAWPVGLSPSDGRSLVSELGELHIYDRDTGLFVLQDAKVQTDIMAGKSDSWISVCDLLGKPWVAQRLNGTVNFSEPERALVFNCQIDKAVINTWLVRFADAQALFKVQEAFSAALFGTNGMSWDKATPLDKQYVRDAMIDDIVMGTESDEEDDGDDEFADAEDDQNASDASHDASDYSDAESDGDEASTGIENQGHIKAELLGNQERAKTASKAAFRPVRPAMAGKPAGKNSRLAVGHKNNLSFVVRGDMIGVFKQTNQGKKRLKFMTSISGLKTPDGKSFNPSQAMLHSDDTAMILQNPLAPSSLFKLDLERGQVVEEFKVQKGGDTDVDVRDVLPSSKFAQTTTEQTFVGLGKNSVFRVDPRLSGSKLVESQNKEYKTNTDFSAAVTTQSGNIAVAGGKGEIRLYDRLGINAKTSIPALGDPIIGVDVSADGRWVLATCKTYLLLIDASINEGKSAGQNGFTHSFPAAAKPIPKRLSLKPEHAAFMDGNISFTPARFNQGLNQDEKTIVTSTGQYIVAWNFKRIVQGKSPEYTIRRYSDTVVADNFKFGADKEIIVTLPSDVFMESRTQLQRPTKEAFDVVKQWDA